MALTMKCPNCGCDNDREIVRAPSAEELKLSAEYLCLRCRQTFVPGQHPFAPKPPAAS